MNKILLLFLFSCFSCTYIHSQENNSYFYVPEKFQDRVKAKQEKQKIKQAKRDSVNLVFQKRIESNIIAKSGYYLSLSAKYQYGALGCAAISAACLFGASKCDSTTDIHGKTQHSDGYYILNIFGGASAIASVFCGIMTINYKLKSGKCLMLSPTPNGVTASLNF
ncbi:hypothetical protein KUBF_30500 [Bacteroides finegoldii]|nr:hypothetical protein KUBF_30500 [Bacteroides finegoldii]